MPRSLPNASEDVQDWFDAFEHPLKNAMLVVREAILTADDRMTETVKWSTPTFMYKGNLLSFQPRAKKFVSLMFHEGASIPGKHPRLEGDGAHVRTMRFTDAADVEANGAALAEVVRAWCDMKDGR